MLSGFRIVAALLPPIAPITLSSTLADKSDLPLVTFLPGVLWQARSLLDEKEGFVLARQLPGPGRGLNYEHVGRC